MQRVRDLGEFGLIERIARLAGRATGADVVLGIGDDAAILRLRAGEELVVTTDAAVAGVHFRFDQETPRIGRPAGARWAASRTSRRWARARSACCSRSRLRPHCRAATALGLVRGIVVESRRAAPRWWAAT